MEQTVKQIEHLRELHHEYNRDYFSGTLLTIPILIKRNRNKDGYYIYRAHRNDTPIVRELGRACIVISEDHYRPGPPDWEGIYGTLLHEMIHQYQAEVLNEDPDHNDIFNEMADTIERATGYPVK